MLNTTPAKVDNVSAVAHTELSERAGNGRTDAPQLPQVQVPHGTTTAFRPVTKSLTAQTILPPNLEELNIELAILLREIDLAKLPLNNEEGPATR